VGGDGLRRGGRGCCRHADAKKLQAMEERWGAEGCAAKAGEDEGCVRLKAGLEEQRTATQQMKVAIARWQAEPLVVVSSTGLSRPTWLAWLAASLLI
jgi:hypothetical protein